MALSLVINQRYRIGRRCFVPSLGEAFDAYDLKEFCSVTVWILPKCRKSLADIFFDENSKASNASPRHTPQILDQGIDDQSSRLFIVFEYIEVQTLEEVLENEKELSPDRALNIFVHLLEALRILHNANVVHGRLNPMNLLVARDSEKVIGFGLTYLQKASDLPTKLLPFLSPEQLQGEDKAIASDLYSAGAILYSSLIGESIFVPTDFEEYYFPSDEVVKKNIASLMDIPSELKPILTKLLKFDPSKRYLLSAPVLKDLSSIDGLI